MELFIKIVFWWFICEAIWLFKNCIECEYPNGERTHGHTAIGDTFSLAMWIAIIIALFNLIWR